MGRDTDRLERRPEIRTTMSDAIRNCPVLVIKFNRLTRICPSFLTYDNYAGMD
jgi:hypothetical protein